MLPYTVRPANSSHPPQPIRPYSEIVPDRLKRYYGAKHLHFITASCYHRLPILDTASRRDLFLQILEQTGSVTGLPWI